MSEQALDSILRISIILIWTVLVGLVVFLFLKLQKQIANDEENKIRIKEDEIEKKMDHSSLDELVNYNNTDDDGQG